MKRCMMVGVRDEVCKMRCSAEVSARVGSDEYRNAAL